MPVALSPLVPRGKKTDTARFVGFGGGFDILFTHHFGLRTQADLVYDHLFNDILQDGRFTVRFSIGPAFNFGKNIAKVRSSRARHRPVPLTVTAGLGAGECSSWPAR